MPKKHTIIKYIVPILVITISILFFYILKNTKPAPVQVDAKERAWSVKAMSINKGSHRPVIQLYGQVTTLSDIQLTATIEADIINRHINLGETVKSGQLLLTLDASRLKQTELQRRAELAEMQALIDNEKHQHKTDKALLEHEKALLKIADNAVKRAKTLEKSLMASSSQFDDAKRLQLQQKLSISRLESNIASHPTRLSQLTAKYDQARTRLVLATDDLQQTKIISPVNGVITEIDVDIAEHVRKGTELLSISATEQLEIQSLLPQGLQAQFQQSFLLSSQTDKPLNAIVKMANQQQYSATLHRLPTNINKGQAGSYAFFRFKGPVPPVLIGETVTVFAELQEEKNTIALPHDAIYGTDSIFTIIDERLNRVPINWLGETFINNQKMILIRSDELNDGSQVLVSKFANAMHGLKVDVNNNSSKVPGHNDK